MDIKNRHKNNNFIAWPRNEVVVVQWYDFHNSSVCRRHQQRIILITCTFRIPKEISKIYSKNKRYYRCIRMNRKSKENRQ